MALFVDLPNEAAPRMSDENSKDEPWRKRKMIQGRWRDPDDQTDVVQRVEKTISVKLLEAERDEFDAQIAKLGIKRNRAMRIAARRIGGFLELDPETIGILRAVTRSISGIAVNVNQIAKAANRTHDPDYQRFFRERAELGKEIARLDAVLQPLLDVAQRRSDGLQRLKDASE